jgi:transcriptional regulator of heat shock response
VYKDIADSYSFRSVAILTTNRKDEIDEAFQSILSNHTAIHVLISTFTGRVHFTVHYPDLNESSRQEVWKNFLQNAAKTSELSEFTEEEFASLSRYKLNGRQVCGTSQSISQKLWRPRCLTASRLRMLFPARSRWPGSRSNILIKRTLICF